jgi:hypothetical protein
MGTTGNATPHEPWNTGKIVGQKAPFELKGIWALRVRLEVEGRFRDQREAHEVGRFAVASTRPPTPRPRREPPRGRAGRTSRRRRASACHSRSAAFAATVRVPRQRSAQDRADQLDFAGAACAGQSAEDAQADVEALLADPRLTQGMLVRFGLAALLSVPFWQAPPLVYWQGQGVAQALFSSTLALWRCKGAFAVYALAWFAVIVVFAAIAALLFSLLGARQLAGVVAMPAALVFSTVFYVSLLFPYEGCFSEGRRAFAAGDLRCPCARPACPASVALELPGGLRPGAALRCCDESSHCVASTRRMGPPTGLPTPFSGILIGSGITSLRDMSLRRSAARFHSVGHPAVGPFSGAPTPLPFVWAKRLVGGVGARSRCRQSR